MKKALLFLAVAFGLLSTAFAQSKDNVARECVLFEVFTGVHCPYCPAAANGIAQMMEEGLAIAPVAYHTTAFSTDLYYTNETNARASYYGITGYPTLKADGVTGVSGGGGAGESMYSYYMNYYNQRINVTSPFTIDLSYECVEGNVCRVNCTVNQVGDCSGTDVRVFIALTQCNIDVGWQGMQGLHHVCRDMIPTQTGTPFTGPTMTISENFEMNWPKEDCFLTAWVQNYSGGTKEVYQAVRMSTALDLDYDLILKGVDNVVTENCSGVQHPRLTVANYGHESINTFDVRVFDGVESHKQTWNGTLPQGEMVDVVMDDFVAGTTGTLQLFVEMPNGHVDEFMADNVASAEMGDVVTVDGALTLQLRTGAHPENISFEIKNMDTGEIAYSFTYDQANHVYKADIVLSYEACYRLTVRDAAGEGMGSGFFQVKDSNNTVVFKGGNSAGRFTYELATELHCNGFVALEENNSLSPSTDSGAFAFVSDGNIIINGEGVLQIVDVMGRVIVNADVARNVSTSGMVPGVYVLRLVDGEKVRTQKVVLH